jgi:hypothetical protein
MGSFSLQLPLPGPALYGAQTRLPQVGMLAVDLAPYSSEEVKGKDETTPFSQE